MNIQKLKERIEKLKVKELNLQMREEAISEINTIRNVVANKIRESVQTNNMSLLKEVLSPIKESLANINTNDIVKTIEDKIETIDNESGKKILNELKNMLNEIKTLEAKTYFNMEDLNEMFFRYTNRIIDAILTSEELPQNTEYFRNQQGKILRVIEKYNNHTLEHNWNYDSNDNLIRVTTIRK